MDERKVPSYGLCVHLVQLWGVMGVATILGKGIKRVAPIALEPVRSGTTHSPIFWGSYAGFALFMAYAEGYEGFHKGFSPKVVARSLTLHAKGVLTRLFAPLYCMELFDAPAHRVGKAWSFVSAIALVVATVKRLPSDARAIVDAGVCTGLSVGILSLFYHYSRVVFVGGEVTLDMAPTTDTTSYCPVMFVSSTINGTLDFFAHRVLGKRFSELPEKGGESQRCPVSGKEGDGCPLAKVLGNQGLDSAPKPEDVSVLEPTLSAASATSRAPSAFMAGKSLVAAVQKTEVQQVSLLYRICPLHWGGVAVMCRRVAAICFLQVLIRGLLDQRFSRRSLGNSSE